MTWMMESPLLLWCSHFYFHFAPATQFCSEVHTSAIAPLCQSKNKNKELSINVRQIAETHQSGGLALRCEYLSGKFLQQRCAKSESHPSLGICRCVPCTLPPRTRRGAFCSVLTIIQTEQTQIEEKICFQKYTTHGGTTSEGANFMLLCTSDWRTYWYISGMPGQKHGNVPVCQ